MRREGDDARLRGSPRDLARRAGPAAVGHAYVQQDHIGVAQRRDPDGFIRVVRGGDDRQPIGLLHRLDEGASDHLVVVCRSIRGFGDSARAKVVGGR